MIYVHGAGHFHPENVIDNRFLEDLDIGCDATWTLERVGIATRRTVLPLDYIRSTKNGNVVAANEAALYSNAETGAFASEMAIKRAGILRSEIGMVISGSCTPQFSVPAEACTIAEKLGIEAYSFDISSACTSFLAQLNYLNTVKPECLPDYVLLVCPENNTRVIDYADRSAAVLWGDATSAMVVSTKIKSRMSFSQVVMNSSPAGWDAVKVPFGKHFVQSGRTVQTFAIKKSVGLIRGLREGLSFEKNASLKYIGHQANYLMLESVCKLAEISPQSHFSNVQDYGNTGAAGAPTVLSQNWDTWKSGDVIVFALVGAGLTWGGSLVQVGEGK